MDMKNLIERMKKIGFTEVAEVNVKDLVPMPEIRQMCAADRCGAYGHKWSCPPYCGTLEECTERIQARQNGIIMTTATQLEDSFDYEGMQEGGCRHQKQFLQAVEELRPEYPDLLPLGAGGCRNCETCTCPDEPCRFPDKMMVPMEAYGLFVSDVCRRNGVKYNNGEATVTYVSCILF